MPVHNNPKAPSWYKKLQHNMKVPNVGVQATRHVDNPSSGNIAIDEVETLVEERTDDKPQLKVRVNNGYANENEAQSPSPGSPGSYHYQQLMLTPTYCDEGGGGEVDDGDDDDDDNDDDDGRDHQVEVKRPSTHHRLSLLDPPIIPKEKSFMQIQHELALARSQGIIKGLLFYF